LHVDLQYDGVLKGAEVEAVVESFERHVDDAGLMHAECQRLALAWLEQRRAVRSIGHVKPGRTVRAGECVGQQLGEVVVGEDRREGVGCFRQRLEGDDPRIRAKPSEGETELPLVCPGVDQSIASAMAYGVQVFGRSSHAMANKCRKEVGASEYVQALANAG
jgi:hypothetical protein